MDTLWERRHRWLDQIQAGRLAEVDLASPTEKDLIWLRDCLQRHHGFSGGLTDVERYLETASLPNKATHPTPVSEDKILSSEEIVSRLPSRGCWIPLPSWGQATWLKKTGWAMRVGPILKRVAWGWRTVGVLATLGMFMALSQWVGIVEGLRFSMAHGGALNLQTPLPPDAFDRLNGWGQACRAYSGFVVAWAAFEMGLAFTVSRMQWSPAKLTEDDLLRTQKSLLVSQYLAQRITPWPLSRQEWKALKKAIEEEEKHQLHYVLISGGPQALSSE